MEYQFILIYSDGPMGSTSLGSLFEKYGFLNLPYRKFFLSEYIMGIRKIEDKKMQYRCIENLNELSNLKVIGGTSMKDRNSRKGKIRAFKPTKEEINHFLAYEPKNLSSLLSHCFIFTAKHLNYKNFNIPLRGFVIYEMPQFKINYNFTQYQYLKVITKLKNFKCFIMNRNFKEWSASIISQADCKSKRRFMLPKIPLEKLFKRWKEIQNLSSMDSLYSINIDSIHLPNTLKTNILVSQITNLPLIDEDLLKSQEYDLYGSLLSYKKAFTPADRSFQDTIFINKILLGNYTKLPFIIRYFLDINFNFLRFLGFLKVY